MQEWIDGFSVTNITIFFVAIAIILILDFVLDYYFWFAFLDSKHLLHPSHRVVGIFHPDNLSNYFSFTCFTYNYIVTEHDKHNGDITINT